MIDFTFLSDDDIPLRTPQRWRALHKVQKMVEKIVEVPQVQVIEVEQVVERIVNIPHI